MKKIKHILAVYGTLRENFSNHRYLRNKSKKLGTQKIKGFDMYSLGYYPMVQRGKGEIEIEVYEVTDENTLRDIYNLEGYSGIRDSSNNWYDTTDVVTEFGNAELFYMKNKDECNNNPLVKDGIWK